jgi:hypothetical protein
VGGLREQSHLDDMRAAVRGDLERARKRREAGQTTGPAPLDLRTPPEPRKIDEPTHDPEAELEPKAQLEPEPDTAPEPAPKRSVWSRLRR